MGIFLLVLSSFLLVKAKEINPFKKIKKNKKQKQRFFESIIFLASPKPCKSYRYLDYPVLFNESDV